MSENDQSPYDNSPGSVVTTEKKPLVKTPSFYKVILLNDDFTPMDFVIHVLTKFFNKTADEAQKIMLEVHHQGAGVAGIFTYEIGETKVFLVNQYAKQHKYPLKSVLEKA
jgi:ATP-dependent Clp protease adaptor protein ClpS